MSDPGSDGAGTDVAVASFSAQEALLRETPRLAMAAGNVHASSVAVAGGRNRSERDGKRRQLEQVLKTLPGTSYPKGGVPESWTITKTLLIDDDQTNVRMARNDGYISFWFDAGKVDTFLSSIIAWNP